MQSTSIIAIDGPLFGAPRGTSSPTVDRLHAPPPGLATLSDCAGRWWPRLRPGTRCPRASSAPPRPRAAGGLGIGEAALLLGQGQAASYPLRSQPAGLGPRDHRRRPDSHLLADYHFADLYHRTQVGVVRNCRP